MYFGVWRNKHCILTISYIYRARENDMCSSRIYHMRRHHSCVYLNHLQHVWCLLYPDNHLYRLLHFSHWYLSGLCILICCERFFLHLNSLAYLTCDWLGVLGEYTLLVPDDFDKLHVLMCLFLSALEKTCLVALTAHILLCLIMVVTHVGLQRVLFLKSLFWFADGAIQFKFPGMALLVSL